MKYLPPVIVIGLIMLSAPHAQAQSGEYDPPVRADFGYASEYVVRGVSRAGASAQMGLQFARERLRGGININQPFDDDDSREVGLTIAHAWEIQDNVDLRASVAHTWFSRTLAVHRSLEAGLAATFSPVGDFTPGLGYYRDFRFDSDTLEASVARSVPLTKLGAFLEFSFFAGLVHGRDWRPDEGGPRRQDGYGYFGGEVQLPYRIGPHATLNAGVHYADSWGRSASNGPFGRVGGGKIWLTLGVNVDF